jgi:hypothetical protein
VQFRCDFNYCSHRGQEIEIRAEQLIPVAQSTERVAELIKQYEETSTPFFFTIPPVYCGYCGQPALRVVSSVRDSGLDQLSG